MGTVQPRLIAGAGLNREATDPSLAILFSLLGIYCWKWKVLGSRSTRMAAFWNVLKPFAESPEMPRVSPLAGLWLGSSASGVRGAPSSIR